MRNEERLIVDEYMYGNDIDAQLAKDEKKKAMFIESKINYEDVQTMLKIYEKAIKDKVFKTPTGHEFLKKMRKQMICQGVPEEKIIPIPLYQTYSQEADIRPVRVFQVKESKDDSKDLLRKSLWLNLALIVLVIGMFCITMFGNNTNILNYRYKIENEYSIWQQQLEERENELREKEAQLKQQ